MSNSARLTASLWLCAAAGAALAAAGAPARAQTVVEELTITGRYSPNGEAQSLSRVVDYGDLDLTSGYGRKELNRRVRLAARDICDRLGEPSGARVGAAPTCEQDAIASAAPQVRTAIAMARPPGAYAVIAPPPAYAYTPPPPPAYDAAPAAPSYSAPASAVAPTYSTETVTNGPVPDTSANRAKYGQPMSRAGRRTTAAGN